MVCGHKSFGLGVPGFSEFFGKECLVPAQGDGINLSTRVYFDSHGLGTISSWKLKVGIECNLAVRFTLHVELAFSPTASGDTIGLYHL